MKWDDLAYWQTGEWQKVQDNLDDLEKKKIIYSPKRENLFAALDAVPFDKVQVAIYGQDPYPDPAHATGVAFSLPKGVKDFPRTLINLFKEYHDDLGLPTPDTGNLDPWVNQGVLLWNVIPSCNAFGSLSHEWPEWKLLTQEITKKLSAQHIVFVLLGGRAREYAKFICDEDSDVLEYSHPSPRGNLNAKVPFLGSRMFSTVNAKLIEQGRGTIDWRL